MKGYFSPLWALGGLWSQLHMPHWMWEHVSPQVAPKYKILFPRCSERSATHVGMYMVFVPGYKRCLRFLLIQNVGGILYRWTHSLYLDTKPGYMCTQCSPTVRRFFVWGKMHGAFVIPHAPTWIPVYTPHPVAKKILITHVCVIQTLAQNKET